MSLDHKTVLSIATLARIRVPDDDVPGLAAELANILDWVEQLAEVETHDTPPMTSVVGEGLPQREDAVNDGGYPDDILANAPEQTQGFFVVPKVVE